MHENERRLSGGERRPTLAWHKQLKKQLHREEMKAKEN